MKNSKSISLLALVLLGISLSSCGGGGGTPPFFNSSSKGGGLFDSSANNSNSYDNSNNSNNSSNSNSSSSGNVEPGEGRSDYALTNDGWRQMIKDSYKYCEELVEQGSVLLKNNYSTLPLKENERRVTLFGQGSKNLFMRSGAAGAAPNESLVTTLDRAFEINGFMINHTVFDRYEKVSNMANPNAKVEHAFSGFYTEEIRDSFADYSDAAIVTLVRIGSENTDPSNGQLDLNSDEASLLKMINQSGVFNKIIVLINSPMPMSMDWANNPEYGVDAIVYMGVPGYYGAGGVVHVLMGKDSQGNAVNPSGHCVDTFAASASSSPAYVNFGNSSLAVYQEGIYVGYKYYETRYEDLVLNQGGANSSKGTFSSQGEWNYADEMGYPFGYGLSYTQFDQRIVSIKEKDGQIVADVEVKNVGDMEGRASVQLYVRAPYTQYDRNYGLGKSAISLMAYDKVLVKPGEQQIINLSFDKSQLCTYDYVNAKTYILEGGEYYFGIGNGAHEALNNILCKIYPRNEFYDHNGDIYVGNQNCAMPLTISDDYVTYSNSQITGNSIFNQFDDADYNYVARRNNKAGITYLDRSNWDGTYPTARISDNPASTNDGDMSQYYSKPYDSPRYSAGDGIDYNVTSYLNGQETLITFAEMSDIPLQGKIEKGRFKGQDGADIWDEFIKQMSLDDLIVSIADNRGILGINKIQKMGNSISEGAEGLLAKFQYGDKRWATGFPTGPIYTGTWDHKMQAKYGDFYAEEALFCGIPAVNGPGVNIIRTPYTSRASEYMSEDGILNYYCVANVVGAARKKGLIMDVKHCFLNNQETGRQRIYTYCNEQALREIYLKPFEGAVTKGQALGIMTSYNRIGAKYAACHQSLMEEVIRNEWGFEGFLMNDALTGSNTDRYANGPAMLHCGTDIFCLDGNRGSQLKQFITQNDDGYLLQDLQRANKYIMYAFSRSWLGDVGPDGGNEDPGEQGSDSFNPITQQIEQICDSFDYDFDPEAVIIKEEDSWNFNDYALASMPANATSRDGYNLVYCFEGAYSEGYQGDYSETYGYLYLWDDGLFSGTINTTSIKGFWYNSSLAEGSDESGRPIKDCLNLVSNIDHYEFIITAPTSGFYDRTAYVYLGFSWGTRSMILNGYYYYPEVAIAIDPSSTGLVFKVGDTFDRSGWAIDRIFKNKTYSAILTPNDVQWFEQSGMLENGRFTRTGTYEVSAYWNGFSASVIVRVVN